MASMREKGPKPKWGETVYSNYSKGGSKGKGRSEGGKGEGKKGKGKKGDGKKGKGKGKGKKGREVEEDAATIEQRKQLRRHESAARKTKDVSVATLQELQTLTTGKWYELPDGSPGQLGEQHAEAINARADLELNARKIYAEKCDLFEGTIAKDDEQAWLGKMAVTGTTTDKINALRMKIQMAPVFALPHIRILLSMAQKKSRHESGAAIDALKEVFEDETTLPDRKLRTFEQQCAAVWGDSEFAAKRRGKKSGPAESVDYSVLSDKLLGEQGRLRIYLEDALKICYAAFLRVLVDGTHDNVSVHKNKWLGSCGTFISGGLLDPVCPEFGLPDRRLVIKGRCALAGSGTNRRQIAG